MLPRIQAKSPRVNGVESRDQESQRAAKLIARMALGETGAARELYEIYATPIYSYILRVLGSVEDAEEVLQDAFVRLWDKAADYDADLSKPFTWTVMIARGLCYDRLRRGRRRIRMVDHSVVTRGEAVSFPEVFQRAEIDHVRMALAKLGDADRRAVEMAIFLDHTGSEIASLTNEPLGTVKSRIRRGLAKLRQILRDHE